MINYYNVLGVSEDATSLELKRAYRKLLLKCHPDVNSSSDAVERSEGVISAYNVLSCPESRYDHDLELKKAGLSSKILFNKNRYQCNACSGTGLINIRPDSEFRIWGKFVYKFKNILTQEQQLTKACLDCCGQGIIHRIEEL